MISNYLILCSVVQHEPTWIFIADGSSTFIYPSSNGNWLKIECCKLSLLFYGDIVTTSCKTGKFHSFACRTYTGLHYFVHHWRHLFLRHRQTKCSYYYRDLKPFVLLLLVKSKIPAHKFNKSHLAIQCHCRVSW